MTLRSLALSLLALSMHDAFAESGDSVPVEQEPQHKTFFKNEFLQAFRVKLEPGQVSLMHRHEHDDAAVRLSDNTSTSQNLGEAEGPPQTAVIGQVTARDNETRPTIHRVRNVGSTLFDVIDVQVLARPPGPAAEAFAAPVAENPKMRMYRYELAPGASAPPHAHARPYALIAATAMTLRTTTSTGASTDAVLAAGDLQWVDSAATHTYTNRGSAPGILVEFELK
jgi:quercetin dioxygenase-like cupin family protein